TPEIGGDELRGGTGPVTDGGDFAVAAIAQSRRAAGPGVVVEAEAEPVGALVGAIVQIPPNGTARDKRKRQGLRTRAQGGEDQTRQQTNSSAPRKDWADGCHGFWETYITGEFAQERVGARCTGRCRERMPGWFWLQRGCARPNGKQRHSRFGGPDIAGHSRT